MLNIVEYAENIWVILIIISNYNLHFDATMKNIHVSQRDLQFISPCLYRSVSSAVFSANVRCGYPNPINATQQSGMNKCAVLSRETSSCEETN